MARPTDLPTALPLQFDLAAPVLLRNGWVGAAAAAPLRSETEQAPPVTPAGGRSLIATWLLERKTLTSEQASDLDAILRHQSYLDGFLLLRKLGSGGMGTVFLATHLASGRDVALKTINTRLADDADFVSRFHREAKALASVHHPHVAEILESGEIDGHCYMAMEFIKGSSLMELVKEHGVLPEAYALHIIRQVAEGLAHVWTAAQLVHRDIKPENILVVRAQAAADNLFPLEDQAKLIDFGLVKSNKEDERLTQTGMTIGTPLYMSPEQVRGEKLDCRSDLYGLGATLYHLLTGTTPFVGTSPGAIMSAHLTDAVPDPGKRVPSLHVKTRELVMTAMAKDANKRFRTFEHLIAAIDPVLTEVMTKAVDAPRLLRKPLVIKPAPGPARKAVTEEVELPDLPPLANASPEAPAEPPVVPVPAKPSPPALAPAPQPVSRSARRQIQQPSLPAADRPNRIPGARPLANPIPRPSTPRPFATPAAPPRMTDPAEAPPSPPSAPMPVKPSAAYANDLDQSGGIGLLPWLTLGAAVVAFVAYWFLAR